MAKGKGGRREAAKRPSDEVLITQARVYLTFSWFLGVFICLIGLGLFALMAVPLAHAIAGKHTDFGMTVSVSFNAALTATTALTGSGLVVQSRRAARYKTRAKKLENQLADAGNTVLSEAADE